jgi:hypothetical protein
MIMPFARHLAISTLLCCSLEARASLAETAVAPVGSVTSDARHEKLAPDVEKARNHFLQGVQFYNAGDYKLSLIEFRRSYELSKNYRILYNIGQVNQQLGNYTNALSALEQYLHDGGGDVADERVAEVAANVRMLRTRVAHIRVTANVDSPEVLVDGFPVDAKGVSWEIALDPGDHRIDLRKAGYQSGGTVVTLAAGDVSKVNIKLTRVPPVVRVSAPGNHSAPHRDATWLWVGWTTTAATALGAGITGVIAVTQANELANLRNSSWSTQGQRDEVGSRAKAFAIASDALAIAAVAAGATSLFLTLRSDKVEPEGPPKPTTRLALTAGGVAFEHRF